MLKKILLASLATVSLFASDITKNEVYLGTIDRDFGLESASFLEIQANTMIRGQFINSIGIFGEDYLDLSIAYQHLVLPASVAESYLYLGTGYFKDDVANIDSGYIKLGMDITEQIAQDFSVNATFGVRYMENDKFDGFTKEFSITPTYQISQTKFIGLKFDGISHELDSGRYNTASIALAYRANF